MWKFSEQKKVIIIFDSINVNHGKALICVDKQTTLIDTNSWVFLERFVLANPFPQYISSPVGHRGFPGQQQTAMARTTDHNGHIRLTLS